MCNNDPSLFKQLESDGQVCSFKQPNEFLLCERLQQSFVQETADRKQGTLIYCISAVKVSSLNRKIKIYINYVTDGKETCLLGLYSYYSVINSNTIICNLFTSSLLAE